MTTTSVPTLTVERTGATYKAVVRYVGGTHVSYEHATIEAAQAAGRRVLDQQQPSTTTGTMRFTVQPVGRMR